MEFSELEKEKIKRLSPIMQGVLLQLIKAIEQILNGECNFNDKHSKQLLEEISILISPERYLSKTQSASKLGVSERQFDRYVKAGIIPKGVRQKGFKELSWKKSVLDEYLSNKRLG